MLGNRRRESANRVCCDGTINYSINVGKQGVFLLNALPDSEEFYRKVKMVPTGNVNNVGLKEFIMGKDKADSFLRKFEKHMI
jgi:hypothetical protein